MAAMTDDEDPRALIAHLRNLSEQYGRRDAERGNAAAVVRGQWFNGFLADLLRLYGIDAHSDQQGRGQRDEVDVFFRLRGNTFVLEGKWTAKNIDGTPVAKLAELLRVRPRGTYGVLISMHGYTRAVIERAEQNADVLLLGREHVEALVAGVTGPVELFESLLEHTGLRGGGLAPLAQLLRPVKTPQLPTWVPAGAPDAPTPPPEVEYAAPGVQVTPLHTAAKPWFTPWSGMAADGESLLLTCQDGIVRFEPATGSSRWEHVVPGCHGPAARGEDGRLQVVCGHGVLALGPGAAIAPVGGPVERGARLPIGAEGGYVFATTGPPGPVYRGSHLLTRLNGAVGRDETLAIDYPGDIRQVAVMPGGRLYLVGSYWAGVLPIGPLMRLPQDRCFPAAPLAETGALLPLDEHRILSAGRDSAGVRVELYLTDLRTREHELLLRLHAGSATALVRALHPGTFYLLAGVWGHASAPRAMLLQLNLPV